MSENLVPYGVGFASGAGFVMVRNLLKKRNAQDTAVGLSYSKKSSPCREEPVEDADEDEPLTVTQQETEATYIDMRPTYTHEKIEYPPDSVVEYVNWPPGAVLQEPGQEQIYEPVSSIERPEQEQIYEQHIYESVRYSSIERPEQEQQQPIEYSSIRHPNLPGAVSKQQQHIYETIYPPDMSVVTYTNPSRQQQHIYEPIRADVERAKYN